MRKGLPWVLGVWFLSAGQLTAQSLPATGSVAGGAPGAGELSAKPAISTVDGPMDLRSWVRVEYLLWWVKDAPLPVPIVTTGDPRIGFDPNQVNTVNTAGAIGQQGTQVLVGGHDLTTSPFSGMRLTLGGWIDESDLIGVEGSGFILERLTNAFTAASDKTGNPPLYFPILSAVSGAERGIPIADPLRSFSGAVAVTSNLQLWGAECNGVLCLIRNAGLELTALAGFRYADLTEALHMDNTTTDLVFNNVTNLHDAFATRNQFYGGQVGSRLGVQRGRFSLDITGKVALGATHEVVDIQGDITQLGPNAAVPPGPGTFPGGLFAQPSNIGRRSASSFAVLPSLDLNLGWEMTERARVFVGYDLLYWNHVVRPGAQVDHEVNLTQNAVLNSNGVGQLVGPARPAPLFQRGDFWAQGINAGLEFRY